MTIGLDLGTGRNSQNVYTIAKAVGFSLEKIDSYLKKPIPIHTTVPHLRLLINNPCYLKGIKGIITEIGFDDSSDRVRDKELEKISGENIRYHINPQAIEVLKKMYEQLPDLVYLKSFNEWAKAKDKTQVERPPLSEYFTLLEQRKEQKQ